MTLIEAPNDTGYDGTGLGDSAGLIWLRSGNLLRIRSNRTHEETEEMLLCQSIPSEP
jgi:hypothetical protein